MNAPASRTGRLAERLATLIHLERRARAASDKAELGFIIVNESFGLVAYDRAVLFLPHEKRGHDIVVSGLAETADDAPYTVWLRSVLEILAGDPPDSAVRLDAAMLPAVTPAPEKAWLPDHLIVAPLISEDVRYGLLLLAVERPPEAAELQIVDLLVEAYGHAWAALSRSGRRRFSSLGKRSSLAFGSAVAAVALGLAWVPVRTSVLAPAEVIAAEPGIVRSSLDGIVDRIAVQPNEAVQEGALLAVLDGRRLQTQLQAARTAAIATEAELRQAQQAAVMDPKVRAGIPALQGKLDQQNAEIRFLQGQTLRLEIRATQAGIAIFDNPSEWAGRPVVAGERIMQIAEPSKVELEIRLAAADAIHFPERTDVRFFRNTDPSAPVEARLTFSGYKSTPGPDGIVAYRLKARFEDGSDPLRIGLRGTAKIYGEPIALGYYLTRRPLAALRARLGW